MILTTLDTQSNHRILECLGLAKENTIRARHLGRDILAGLRNIVGGEVIEYTKALAETREQALDRMRDQAVALGADAAVSIRFSSSMVMQGAAEMLAYGTAVRLGPATGTEPTGS